MREANGVLEDVCAEIGFTATMRLVALHPGDLYIPDKVMDGHPIGLMIGDRAFSRLVDCWGGGKLTIPQLAEFDNLRLLPGLARRVSNGDSAKEIARTLGFTEQHVRRLRADAESVGLLPVTPKRHTSDVDAYIPPSTSSATPGAPIEAHDTGNAHRAGSLVTGG